MCRLHLQGEYIEEWQLSNDNIKRYIETYPETLTDEYSDKVITFMARVYSGMFEQIIAE
jgi:hypothetical protein